MLNKKIGLVAVLAMFAFSNVFATTLTNYTVGDVLVCFRIPGNDNLVVDAGPISTFTNAIANQVISISQYTGSQLATVGTNSMSWSAFSWYDDSVSPVSAQWTLFVSKARPSLNTQSFPWVAQNAATQARPAGDMSEIPPGAYDNFHYNANSTKSAIIEPTDSLGAGSGNYPNGLSYADDIYTQNSTPNFDGDLNASPENNTPSNFRTAATVQRSDFYWVPPTDSGNSVKYLGYFELNTNGYMNYVAYPTVAGTAPTVTTTAATAVTNNLATLNGTVNPNSQTTTAYFQYGLTTSYGSNVLVSGTFTGSSAQAVSTNLAWLTFGQTYHFRLTAYNATGTNSGSDLTFNTAAIPMPDIQLFSRVNTNSFISFPTFTTLTYKVRGTNQLSGPITNWPVIASIPGDGGVHTVTNGTGTSNMFYTISAQ
jgi:hypothetical protein